MRAGGGTAVLREHFCLLLSKLCVGTAVAWARGTAGPASIPESMGRFQRSAQWNGPLSASAGSIPSHSRGFAFQVPAAHFHERVDLTGPQPQPTIERGHPVPTGDSGLPVPSAAGFVIQFQPNKPGAAVLQLRMHSTDTVLTLQKQIFAATNVAPCSQRLLFRGKPLRNGTLLDAGVGPGAIIEQAPPSPLHSPHSRRGVSSVPSVPTARPSAAPVVPGWDDTLSPRGFVRKGTETPRHDRHRQRNSAPPQPQPSQATPHPAHLESRPSSSARGPPTATQLAVMHRRGSTSSLSGGGNISESGPRRSYKAASSQGFALAQGQGGGAATPRHSSGTYPPPTPPSVGVTPPAMASPRSLPPRRVGTVCTRLGQLATTNIERIGAASGGATTPGQPPPQPHLSARAAVMLGCSPGVTLAPLLSRGDGVAAASAPFVPPRYPQTSAHAFMPRPLTSTHEYYAVRWAPLARGASVAPAVDGQRWSK